MSWPERFVSYSLRCVEIDTIAVPVFDWRLCVAPFTGAMARYWGCSWHRVQQRIQAVAKAKPLGFF